MLFTMDEQDGVLEEGANLERFSSKEEARKTFDKALGPDARIIDWHEGDFGDCWIKAWHPPELDEDGLAEHDGIKCHFKIPGSHPGGNCWWLVPAEIVYYPEIEIIED